MPSRAALAASTAYPPAMLDEQAAAAYVSISTSILRKLRVERSVPPRVEVGGKKLYRRADLDAWTQSLPTEGELVGAREAQAADEAFG